MVLEINNSTIIYNHYQLTSTKILRSPQSLAIIVCLSEHRTRYKNTRQLHQPKAGCTRHASYAFFERMRLISWRHVLFWCVWYGLRSSRNLFLYWRIRLTALTHFYSNADHTRRIRKGRDVTKSDACAQKTRRTHAVCIHLNFICSIRKNTEWSRHHRLQYYFSVIFSSFAREYLIIKDHTSE